MAGGVIGYQPLDVQGAIAYGKASVPDFTEQDLMRKQLGLRGGELDLARNEALTKAARQAQYQQAVSKLGETGEDGLAQLAIDFPELANELKASGEIRDKASSAKLLREGGEAISTALRDPMAVADYFRKRNEARVASGMEPDDDDEAYAQVFEGGDDNLIKNTVLSMISELNAKGANTTALMDAYKQRYPDATADIKNYEYWLTHDPDVAEGIKQRTKEGEPILMMDEDTDQPVLVSRGSLEHVGGGGGASAGGGAPPPTAMGAGPARVSQILSTKLPAPVVAGFLGNFDVEGGYEGGTGDGGTAGGIAQLRGPRQEMFQQIMGKPISEASHEEQAAFTLWEMEHPEAAGMTVGQRDQIMNAKTPARAAMLIDQFYERSDGKHRKKRIEAANRYGKGGGQLPNQALLRKMALDAIAKGADEAQVRQMAAQLGVTL